MLYHVLMGATYSATLFHLIWSKKISKCKALCVTVLFFLLLVFEIPSSAMYGSVILEADFKLPIQYYYEKIIVTTISHFYVP